MTNLSEKAKAIVAKNWRGAFTVPSEKLYPFQWNWDSGFVALGTSTYDLDMAIKEIESIYSGQWENGMLPHILFHSENETTYFPNYDFWNSNVNPGAPHKPKTSGITQPPVFGFVIEDIYNRHKDDPRVQAFIKSIFPKVLNQHLYFYNYRDPLNEGLIYIYHPWESGRDNSPIWDDALNKIDIEEGSISPYQRRDTQIADASERPTKEQYDRYVYLLELGKKFQYDGIGISDTCPFLIQDCMFNAIFIKSNNSLISLGDELGFDTSTLKEKNQVSLQNYNDRFWSEELSYYCSYDLRKKQIIPHKEIGGLIPIFAELCNNTQTEILIKYLEDIHNRGFYLCPSFDVDSPLFDSKTILERPSLATYELDDLPRPQIKRSKRTR